MKPAMPEKGKRPFVRLAPIEAELKLDMERYSSGSFGLGLESATVEQDGVKIGTITICAGMGVTIKDERNGRTYGFGAQDLWNAFDGQPEQERG